MIKKKLDLKIGDLDELRADLNRKVEDGNLFVCRGKDYLDEELFSIVGSVKKYEIQEDGTAEFIIRPLMKNYEIEIEEADEVRLSINESEKGIDIRRLILFKNGKYI